jgi:hypothetical protein
MTLTPAQIEALVQANAAALGLRIAAEHKPGVITFVTLAAGMAERVMGQELGTEDESGAVFVPVSPRGTAA